MGKAWQKCTSALLMQQPPLLLAAARPQEQPEGSSLLWPRSPAGAAGGTPARLPGWLCPSDQPSTAKPVPGGPCSDRHHLGQGVLHLQAKAEAATLPATLPALQRWAAQPLQHQPLNGLITPTGKFKMKTAQYFPRGEHTVR